MLVLTRKTGQYADLTHPTTGERIRIVLVELRAGAARIGIDASGEWMITRPDGGPLGDKVRGARGIQQ